MKTLTIIILLAVTSGLIIYDAVAFLHVGNEATISRVLLGAAHDWPLIPFLFGFLMGHLFWPQKGA